MKRRAKQFSIQLHLLSEHLILWIVHVKKAES